MTDRLNREPDNDSPRDITIACLYHQADRRDWQRLEQHPPDYARCLHLFVFDECSCLEIAEQLHITHDAVKTRLYRARKRLAAFYNANSCKNVCF